MSGTEFQANGAVYGNGIYFSDSFQLSLGYSSRSSEKSIVGIFEINDDMEKYKKASNIYVVDNDKIMLLRYLVVVENNQTRNYQEITDYFFKYLSGINKFNEKKSINIKNKRLSGEMKLLDSNQNVLGVTMVDESKHCIIELKNIKDKKIKLIIYFNDYPRLPPKIIIDSNMDKKIISDDLNNLILPELNPSKWDVTLNLSKIVDKVFNCLVSTI
jgi:ubiquitin-protein ligase